MGRFVLGYVDMIDYFSQSQGKEKPNIAELFKCRADLMDEEQ